MTEISTTFRRFVDNRWLSIGPVIDRVLQHFDILRDFFLKTKFDSVTAANTRFKRICLQLQGKLITKVRLQVVRNVSKDFERFLTIFQDSKPLIHELHDEMTELLRNLLLRFVKPELVTDKSATNLVKYLEKDIEGKDFLPNDKIDIGSEASKTLKQLKDDSTKIGHYHAICRDVKKLMEKCAAYLAKKLPLGNVLLKNIACLSPLLRTQPASLQMIVAVVANLPYCNSAEKNDNVIREWRKYQDEVIPEEFFNSSLQIKVREMMELHTSNISLLITIGTESCR
jgi:hypothetical protein